MAEITGLWRVIQEWMDQLPYPPSQRKLAARINVKSPQTISDWKYGVSRPSPEDLRSLADEMEAVAGRDIYQRLLAAVNADMGYQTRRNEAG
jgi:transcriptional regulator with XRE-family HTH domain